MVVCENAVTCAAAWMAGRVSDRLGSPCRDWLAVVPRVPLIVLTGDRPAELRDVGAGQAIDQLKLYGDAVKWFVEVEPADRAVGQDDGPVAPELLR